MGKDGFEISDLRFEISNGETLITRHTSLFFHETTGRW
jgi:hypothetical protein